MSRHAARVEANSVSPPVELRTRLQIEGVIVLLRRDAPFIEAVGDMGHARLGTVCALGAILDRPEQRAQPQVRLVVEPLVAEEQQRMGLKGQADGGISVRHRHPAEIDAVDLCPEPRMKGCAVHR